MVGVLVDATGAAGADGAGSPGWKERVASATDGLLKRWEVKRASACIGGTGKGGSEVLEKRKQSMHDVGKSNFLLTIQTTYHSLQVPHEQPIQYLSRLVAVSHVLKGFGCVLPAHVEENFLSSPVHASM